MNDINEWKKNLSVQERKNVEAFIASIKNDWAHYYTYVSEETGWTRLEIIAQLLRFDMQTLHKGLAAHGEKAAPILDKLIEDLVEDEPWK